mgnify:CR=1 FL=1
MKRERELDFEKTWISLDGKSVIKLNESVDLDNIKVILTEEVDEYVEVLRDMSNLEEFTIGKIYKVAERDGAGGLFLFSHEKGCEGWYFTDDEVKPSTKEAFKAQFKVKKVSIAKLEKKYGCKIEIVK